MDAEIWVVTYGDKCAAYEDGELAYREAASIAYKVASKHPMYYDFELIDKAVKNSRFEEAVNTFNDTDWTSDIILVRSVFVERRESQLLPSRGHDDVSRNKRIHRVSSKIDV